MIDAELLAYLLAAAVAHSGLPAVPLAQLPPVQLLPPEAMTRKLCPEDERTCKDLVAAFEADDYVIYVRDTLDLQTAADNSFLVHELVHVLQYKHRGPAIFYDCPTTLRTEHEAYRAQNAYLKKEGSFARFGDMLNFVSCAAQQENPTRRDILLEPNFSK